MVAEWTAKGPWEAAAEGQEVGLCGLLIWAARNESGKARHLEADKINEGASFKTVAPVIN